ncbi:MAG: PhoH family protein [Cyclobacteriaceae bacterium]|nr:PhoH family protein [Cyclobacteriaceae bacterium]MCH8517254.1 PhoH family protein [Cyclobacteriaceae bacterium]
MEHNEKDSSRKVFVLDTSVILYEHHAFLNFGEHDVVLPITVLEELDTFKKGNETKNFAAREFIRLLDQLSGDRSLADWIPLNGRGKGSIKVVLHQLGSQDTNKIFDTQKNDHYILSAALRVQEDNPDRRVILVSKDINLRIKARALNLPAEDYETGKIKNIQTLSSGKVERTKIDPDLIDELYDKRVIPSNRLFKRRMYGNKYYILKSGVNSILCYHNSAESQLERVDKQQAYGIKPKNAEQAFAMHALLNPHIKLVTIQGVAGTGKTLLALAAALEQKKEYKQIFLARPIVPLSNKDIGYLPGDIKSKLNPYMEPLWDNLKYIQNQWKETDKEYTKITEMVNQEKLVISPLAYIRGRSLSNIIFIVDEAQNLTPHEVKTIITRAGEHTKFIFTGDVHQIDTPYLDAQSNGLSYLIDRVSEHPIYSHVTLEKGERSELANLANDML